MTFFEAIEAIEKIVLKIGMKYSDGSPLPAIVAIGVIGRYHGHRFDFILNSLDAGQISVEEYYLEMVKMIHAFRGRHN